MSDKTTQTLDAAAEVNAAMRAAERTLPLLAVKQSPALVAVYAKLENKGVVTGLEQIRARVRKVCVDELRKARELLAESGLFKEWCIACGFNYNTANSALRRDKEKQSGDGASHNPSPAGEPSGREGGPGDGPGEDEDKGKDKPPKPAVLKLTCKDETDLKRAVDGLLKVIGDQRGTTYEEALLYLVDTYAGWVAPVQQKKAS